MTKTREHCWSLLIDAVSLGLPMQDYTNAKEMFDYGEWGVGFEVIIDQLYEFDITITENFYVQVEAVASNLTIPPTRYSFLKELILHS